MCVRHLQKFFAHLIERCAQKEEGYYGNRKKNGLPGGNPYSDAEPDIFQAQPRPAFGVGAGVLRKRQRFRGGIKNVFFFATADKFF